MTERPLTLTIKYHALDLLSQLLTFKFPFLILPDLEKICVKFAIQKTTHILKYIFNVVSSDL